MGGSMKRLKLFLAVLLVLAFAQSADAFRFPPIGQTLVATYSEAAYISKDGTNDFLWPTSDISAYAGVEGTRATHMAYIWSAGKRAIAYLGAAGAGETGGGNLFTANQNFETGGTGGDFDGGAEADDGTSDNFTDWIEEQVNDGLGNKVEATTTAQGGTYACKITNTTSVLIGVNSKLNASTLTPLALYRYSAYTRGDGSVWQGGVGLYDRSNGSQVIPITATGVTGTDYTQVFKYVTAPVGCTSIDMQLKNYGTSGVCYWDTCAVEKITDCPATGLHCFSDITCNTRGYVSDTGIDLNAATKTIQIFKLR